MFKTIIARYAGTCKRCQGTFPAGTKIRFGGAGRTYHLKADCVGEGISEPLELRADANDNIRLMDPLPMRDAELVEYPQTLGEERAQEALVRWDDAF